MRAQKGQQQTTSFREWQTVCRRSQSMTGKADFPILSQYNHIKRQTQNKFNFQLNWTLYTQSRQMRAQRRWQYN